MSEMEPRETEIDGLLRRCMAAPVPSLPSEFAAARPMPPNSAHWLRPNVGSGLRVGDAWPRARLGGNSGDDHRATRFAYGRAVGAGNLRLARPVGILRRAAGGFGCSVSLVKCSGW